MFQEVIVCDRCGAEGCIVKEIAVQPVNPRLTMTEFAKKHGHPRGKTQVCEESQRANNRAFEIKCPHCGYSHRFQPRATAKLAQPDKPAKPEREPKGRK